MERGSGVQVSWSVPGITHLSPADSKPSRHVRIQHTGASPRDGLSTLQSRKTPED